MLRINYRMRPRKLSQAMGRDKDGKGLGPQGRLDRMKLLVTALFRHERLEGSFSYLDEARGYAERVIY